MKRKTIDGKRYVMISEDEFINMGGQVIGDTVFDFCNSNDVKPEMGLALGMFASTVVGDIAKKMFKAKREEG